jgi:hypothetical protein
MDWDTPPRTRLFAVAALLIGSLGLYAVGSGELPLLWRGHTPDPHGFRELNAAERAESWRDAPASLSPSAAASAAQRDAQALRAAAGLSAPHYMLTTKGEASWHLANPAASLLPGPREARGPGPLLTRESAEPEEVRLPSGKRSSSEKASPTAQEVRAAALASAAGEEPKPSPLGPPGRRAVFRAGRRVVREELLTSGPEPSFGRRSRRLRPVLRADPRLPSRAARRALRLRFRPILLSKLLGRASIRPPRGAITVPDFSRLTALKPRSLPDGRPVPGPAGDEEIENLSPSTLPSCSERRETAAHWHLPAGATTPALWHAGSAFGLEANGGWVWLARAGGRFWAHTAADQPSWLRYRERWWWRSDGLWFMLHDGEAWGYKILHDSGQEGFGHPSTGAELIYSADGRVAALVIPGQGALVYDAYTGVILARLGPESLPRRAQPKAPGSLRLPW